MKESAFELAKSWSNNSYIDESDREHINKLLSDPSANESEIIDSFYKDLEFGTGGLRAIIGIGSNRINKYNIRKATQALSNWILSQSSPGPKACISFDCRQYSKEFAMQAASVFAANGIKTYIYPELTPTPMLSYAIRHFKADGGIMLTASHNPKQYNGFKAYGADGAQVTPPHDTNIIQQYNSIKEWDEIKFVEFESALNDKMIEWISPECNESFYNQIIDQGINTQLCKENGEKVKFVFTPLHGCGYPACEIVSKKQGFTNFEIVESQAKPDPFFSTVESTPNPEDPIALKQVVQQMKDSGADIAYGTDPDCDRLGVVVNHKGNEQYLNGNQIAILMLHYIFSQRKEMGTLPTNPLVIKSIVTSPMQKTIVESFGGTVLDTLTGFKWMARLWKDLESDGTDYNYVFASEESFGYMPFDFVRDKDAVASIALMNEIVLFYKLQNKTLMDALDEIYTEHGYYEESLIALTFEGIEGRNKIDRIMKYFRTNPSAEIAGHKATKFQDFEISKVINFETNEITDLEITKSNVLSFEFSSGDILFLRPSGTEPKIKFYTMVRANEGNLEQKKEAAKKKIQEIESFIHKTVEEL